MRLTLYITLFASAAVLLAKDRAWQVGRIAESITKQTGQVATVESDGTTKTNGYGGGIMYGSETKNSSDSKITVKALETSVVFLVGQEYIYALEPPSGPSRAGLAISALTGARPVAHPSRKGCRFVIGDEVKYSQERGVLHIIDADAKECQINIVRQERIAPTLRPTNQ